MWDDLEWQRDDLLIDADQIEEVGTASFWEGYREDDIPLAERDFDCEDAA